MNGIQQEMATLHVFNELYAFTQKVRRTMNRNYKIKVDGKHYVSMRKSRMFPFEVSIECNCALQKHSTAWLQPKNTLQCRVVAKGIVLEVMSCREKETV